MNTTAIIVNYHTSSFLPPLLKILNSEPEISEIIVADNSAEAGLAEILSGFSKVRLMVFPENIGFAAAVNRAAENCNSGWFLVINPDTLPDNGFLGKLICGAKQSDALIAGPRFFWDDKKTYKFPPSVGNSWWMQTGIEAANVFEIDAKLLSFYLDLRFDRFWKEEEPFYEPFLSGGCLLIKNDKTFFRDGKIFDERFYLYFEDTDLCVKAMAHNRTMVCVPDAHVVHYWNQSPSEQKARFMAESHQLFIEKYYQKNLTGFQNLLGFDSKKHDLDTNLLVPHMRDTNLEGFTKDLGEVSEPPKFFVGQMPKTGSLSFEMGLNPLFVPYIQTDVKNQTFEIPPEIWQVMPPAQYFGRIRNSLNKTIAKWKWIKP